MGEMADYFALLLTAGTAREKKRDGVLNLFAL